MLLIPDATMARLRREIENVAGFRGLEEVEEFKGLRVKVLNEYTLEKKTTEFTFWIGVD